MILVVPISNAADATQVTTLEGVEYTLRFRYNQREDAYYLDIADGAGVLIVGGIKLVHGRGLTQRYHFSALPPGEFLVMSATRETPRYGTWGDSAELWYVTSDEFAP